MSIAQQNAAFEAARQKGIKNPSLIGKPGSGAISQAEYNQAMAYQNKQTYPSNFVGPITPKQSSPSPMPEAYWESKTGTPKGYTQVTPEQNKQLTELSKIAEENKVFIAAEKNKEIEGPAYNTAIYSQYERARKIDPTIPEGMIVSNVQTESGRVNYEPLQYRGSNSFFGTTSGYMKDGQMISQIATGMNGEPLYEFPAPKGSPKGLSYAENRALTGLTLATSVAIPLAPFRAGITLAAAKSASFVAPITGGVVFTGGAEAYKYITTGEHLSAEEAINIFGLGEVVGLGLQAFNAKVVAPRVQRGLSKSFEKTLGIDEMWKPSVTEQIKMKVTGAKPNAPSLQAKATELLTSKYTANELVNEKTMFGPDDTAYWKPTDTEQQIFGFKGIKDYQAPKLWSPTAKDTQLMELVGAKVRGPSPGYVSSTNLPSNNPLTLKGMEAEWGSFEMGIAPKTSLLTNSKIPASPTNIKPGAYSKTPLLGYKFTNDKFSDKATYTDVTTDDIYGAKADLKRMEQAEAEQLKMFDEKIGGLPEQNKTINPKKIDLGSDKRLGYDDLQTMSFKKQPKIPALSKETLKRNSLDIALEKELTRRTGLTNIAAKENKFFSETYGVPKVDVILAGRQNAFFHQGEKDQFITVGQKYQGETFQFTVQHELGHATHMNLAQTVLGRQILAKNQYPSIFDATIGQGEVIAWKIGSTSNKTPTAKTKKAFNKIAFDSLATYGVYNPTNVLKRTRARYRAINRFKTISNIELFFKMPWSHFFPETISNKTPITIEPLEVPALTETYKQPASIFTPTTYSRSPYPGTAQKIIFEEETDFLSLPNSGLMHPQQPQFITKLTQKTTTKTRLQPAQMMYQPQNYNSLLTKNTQKNNPSLIQMQRSIQIPSLAQIQKSSAIQTTSLIPQFKTVTAQKQTPMFKTPQPQMPIMPKGFPTMPAFNLGGGFDSLGPKGNRSGQWFQKKHKIKTYTQMLNTFGLGKAAKPMRTVDRVLSKHINKLDRKIIKRSVKHKRK